MRTTTVLLLALLIGLAVARCGGDGSGTAAETARDGTSNPPPSTAVETETEATTTAEEAPCDAEDFLPVLKRAFDGTAPKLRIVRAEVERCRNDYAQVFAVPEASVCDPGVGYCYETEQVFLHWRGERWRILTSGTGIACGSGAETSPLIIRACRALGYPDLASPIFRMPSGNIGCALMAGLLRCDILSGLRPEPGVACEFDWVGLVLPRDGAAEPNCGSDTVYDAGAPTLAYGSRWRRDGVTCDSSETGLSCTNRAGRGFTLARAGWTVS